MVRFLLFAPLAAIAALAQTAQPAQPSRPGGIPPEWVVAKQLSSLSDHVQRLRPLLDKVEPGQWQGAPGGYAGQVERTKAEIGYLVNASSALSTHPEKLTLALETYFRLQSVDDLLRSVASGVRKYQNAALAELLEGLINDTGADREKLRQYVVDLAADREQQFRVADQEAQRCRSVLSKQPRGKHAESKAESKEVRP